LLDEDANHSCVTFPLVICTFLQTKPTSHWAVP